MQNKPLLLVAGASLLIASAVTLAQETMPGKSARPLADTVTSERPSEPMTNKFCKITQPDGTLALGMQFLGGADGQFPGRGATDGQFPGRGATEGDFPGMGKPFSPDEADKNDFNQFAPGTDTTGKPFESGKSGKFADPSKGKFDSMKQGEAGKFPSDMKFPSDGMMPKDGQKSGQFGQQQPGMQQGQQGQTGDANKFPSDMKNSPSDFKGQPGQGQPGQGQPGQGQPGQPPANNGNNPPPPSGGTGGFTPPPGGGGFTPPPGGGQVGAQSATYGNIYFRASANGMMAQAPAKDTWAALDECSGNFTRFQSPTNGEMGARDLMRGKPLADNKLFGDNQKFEEDVFKCPEGQKRVVDKCVSEIKLDLSEIKSVGLDDSNVIETVKTSVQAETVQAQAVQEVAKDVKKCGAQLPPAVEKAAQAVTAIAGSAALKSLTTGDGAVAEGAESKVYAAVEKLDKSGDKLDASLDAAGVPLEDLAKTCELKAEVKAQAADLKLKVKSSSLAGKLKKSFAATAKEYPAFGKMNALVVVKELTKMVNSFDQEAKKVGTGVITEQKFDAMEDALDKSQRLQGLMNFLQDPGKTMSSLNDEFASALKPAIEEYAEALTSEEGQAAYAEVLEDVNALDGAIAKVKSIISKATSKTIDVLKSFQNALLLRQKVKDAPDTLSEFLGSIEEVEFSEEEVNEANSAGDF